MNYIMSHPLLHSATSSPPVIAGFNPQLPGADLPPDSFSFSMGSPSPGSVDMSWSCAPEVFISTTHGSNDRRLLLFSVGGCKFLEHDSPESYLAKRGMA